MNPPRHHHYAPQFFLRNFAVDSERRKITTVGKHGHTAVWATRSIEGLGYERDFYVHMRQGVPVSVETRISERIETPISASDTWQKIASNRADALDRSDKATIYALIRHLHVRTPHALSTLAELARMAASPVSSMPFSDTERELYRHLRGVPGGLKAFVNMMSTTLDWTADAFSGCGLSIMRSPIPLCSSTTPVLTLKAPAHPALRLPLPGMVPHVLILTLNPSTLAMLALGDLDGWFSNTPITADEARGFNRQHVGQFAFFETMRHLIIDRSEVIEEMTWAPYDLVDEDERRVVFKRHHSALDGPTPA